MDIMDKRFEESLELVLIYSDSNNITKSIQKFCDYMIIKKRIIVVNEIESVSHYFELYNKILLIIPLGRTNKNNKYIDLLLKGFYLFGKSSSIIVWDISELDYNKKSLETKYSTFLVDLLKSSYISKENRLVVKKMSNLFWSRKDKKIDFYVKNVLHLRFCISNFFMEDCSNIKKGIYQFPGGEFTIIPTRNTVDGYFIYEKCKYNIENDFIIYDENDLSKGECMHNPICEIGIGLNSKIPKIKYLSCLEKAVGTIHIGIGNNFDLGGGYLLDTHFDIVLDYDNKIYINGKKYELYY